MKNNWSITWQHLILIAVILGLGAFTISLYSNRNSDKQYYEILLKTAQEEKLKALNTADSALTEMMIKDVLLDSVKNKYPKFATNIDSINKYYDEKINNLDSLSMDSIRILLSGK